MKQMARNSAENSKVVALIRASTEAQELGPAAQRAELAAYATAHGLEIVAEHVEHISGSTAIDQRPVLLAAIGDVARFGAGALLVLRRDRLARSAVNAAIVDGLLARHAARVVCVKGDVDPTSAEGRLQATMLDAIAEYERAITRARSAAALAEMRSRGLATGPAARYQRLVRTGSKNPHTGKEYRKVVHDDKAIAGMRAILRWRDEHNLPFSLCAERLFTEHGIGGMRDATRRLTATEARRLYLAAQRLGLAASA